MSFDLEDLKIEKGRFTFHFICMNLDNDCCYSVVVIFDGEKINQAFFDTRNYSGNWMYLYSEQELAMTIPVNLNDKEKLEDWSFYLCETQYEAQVK